VRELLGGTCFLGMLCVFVFLVCLVIVCEQLMDVLFDFGLVFVLFGFGVFGFYDCFFFY